MNILLGVTGSVAAIKLVELVDELSTVGEVKVVVTESALEIIKKTKGCNVWAGGLRTIDSNNRIDRDICNLIRDEDEWKWSEIGDPVLHIDLKDWADVLVIAPLTANTLAKMANGLSDNLLTCICRAWPVTKPIVLAPAMNTDMWNHRLTSNHLTTVDTHYRDADRFIDHQRVFVVHPVEKKLACGTTGIGAMADIKDIAAEVRKRCDQIQEEKEVKTKECSACSNSKA